MYDEDDSYIITSLDDTTVEITAEQIFAAKFIKDRDEYTFKYDSQSISFKKIEVKI